MTTQPMTPSLLKQLEHSHPQIKIGGLVALGITLLTLCAQITIPLNPVPITLQSVAVLFLGLTFPRKAALQSAFAYLGLGILGLPLFTNANHGLSYFMGPTFGYLVGFVLAIYAMTTLRERFFPKPSFINQILLGSLGSLCVFGPGLAWLTHNLGLNTALQVGLLPFILPGLVKIGLLASLLQLKRLFTGSV